MKNLSYILNGVLAVAIVVVYLLLRNDINNIESGEVEHTNKAAATSLQINDFPTSDMVYVNVDSLLMDYNLYNETVEPLETKMQSMDAEYKNELQALQNEAIAENQAYQKGLRTMKSMEEFQAKLEQKKYNLDSKFQSKANALQNQYEQAAAKVQDDIKNYLKELAEAKGYKYVINGSLFWYANQNNDITVQTLNDLNAKYAASK